MKHVFVIAALFVSLSASAQYTSFTPDAVSSATNQVAAEEAKNENVATAKESISSEPVMKIDAKYAAGSCPEVDGKVVWSNTISCAGMTAQKIYDKMIAFLLDYCKQNDKDPISRIAIVNKETHEIGARISEYVVFKDKGLVLDRALFNYTLRVHCFDGKCEVTMQNMSYKYENRNFLAEEMLLDKNALNKTQTDFKKGGYMKFRTKTIDAKDALMEKISECLK